MKRSAGWITLLTIAALSALGQTAVQKTKPNADETRRALGFLLAVSEQVIPSASSCNGSFGQAGHPRVKDLLAMELSSLAGGKNSIVGTCQAAKSCSVTISHELGEAVSSAEISFKLKDGRVQLESLSCLLSP
jgi:hypothetical protein